MAGGTVHIYRVRYHWEQSNKLSHEGDTRFIASATPLDGNQLATILTNNGISKPGAPTPKIETFEFVCTACTV